MVYFGTEMPNSKRNRIRTAYHAITTKDICQIAAGGALTALDILKNVAEAVPDASPQEILDAIEDE